VTDIVPELTDLCAGRRAVVRPFLGRHVAHAHAGEAVGRGVTFAIDGQRQGDA
jgi:hypothetical protein